MPRRRHRLGARQHRRRQERRPHPGDAVRRPCHRGHGPDQDGLPRTEDPLHHPRRRREHPPLAGHRGGHRQYTYRRQADLRPLQPRRHGRHIPVRVSRHAALPARAQAERLRGPHSHERPLPPGPYGENPRIHRPKARTGTYRVRHSRDGGLPEGHLRHHRLSGTGHAPVAPARQLHPRRERHPAQGHG